MKALLVGFMMTGLLSTFAADSVEQAAIEAFEKSGIVSKLTPCVFGEKKTPTAILIEGGGDTNPLEYLILVAQEVNCGFYSKSVLATVEVTGEFDAENERFYFEADVASVKPAVIK